MATPSNGVHQEAIVDYSERPTNRGGNSTIRDITHQAIDGSAPASKQAIKGASILAVDASVGATTGTSVAPVSGTLGSIARAAIPSAVDATHPTSIQYTHTVVDKSFDSMGY
jgi:hypothetical protein